MRTVATIVDSYIRKNRAHQEEQLSAFRDYSLANAVESAALAKDARGKRFAHQRRLSVKALEEAAAVLAGALDEMQKCAKFEDLMELLEGSVAIIPGIGELYVYDTALRIGAHLAIEPDYVYLHAGTREGAEALTIDARREKVHPTELPRELQRLKPREIEDCLCIYKKRLCRMGKGFGDELMDEPGDNSGRSGFRSTRPRC